MKFESDVVRINVPQTDHSFEFKGGTYETDDPAEIAILRDHPRVEEAQPKRRAQKSDEKPDETS